MVTHNKYKPICPTGDMLKPQSDLKDGMNLCSHTVSDAETFHLQMILRSKGSFMTQSHTYLNMMHEEF